jgi:lipopolysaccharide export system permease protein
LELQDVTIFVFESLPSKEQNGKQTDRFLRRIDAEQGVLLENFWQLRQVIVTSADGTAVRHDEYFLDTNLTVRDVQNSFAPPDTISFWSLPSFISKLQESGFSALHHRLYWHTILLSPLFFTAMVFLGSIFSLRPARQGGTGVLITASILTGFLIYFLTNLVSSFGLSGSMPVVLAAWAPIIACTLAGVGMLLHLEDG